MYIKKMSLFTKTKEEEEAEKKNQKICIVSIQSGQPYDTSEQPNTHTCYYVNINFQQMKELYKVIKNDTESENQIFKNIVHHIKDRDTIVFFDFKCCSDCQAGATFLDEDKTLTVFKMINTLTRKHCNIVVGDHSMASLFNHWDRHKMDFKSPIKIHDETTSGPFRMTGKKEDFMASDYPVLKNLGDLSADNKIQIQFENMGGTKVFSINRDVKVDVKVISKGIPLSGRSHDQKENPVHCEFNYRKGKIIVSQTHWCNLTNVNSNVDVHKIRREFSTQYGEDCANQFEVEYTSAVRSGNKERVNRVVSESVRQICSATPATFIIQKKPTPKQEENKLKLGGYDNNLGGYDNNIDDNKYV